MVILWIVLLVPCLSLKIAFGSCAGIFDMSYPKIFETIANWKPDVFIWNGDAIYADVMVAPFYFQPNTIDNMRQKYNNLKNDPGYIKLLSSTRVIGTWDDHDYGVNDGDSTFENKEMSKELFLSFIEEPKNSPRWSQEGIHASYTFEEYGKTFKVILLDDRSLHEKGKTYLGDTQFKWLEKELSDNSTGYLILNGIQILERDHLTSKPEAFYPDELQRLEKILEKKKGVILASGDVHFGEIISYPCLNNGLYEITSSGLTHSLNTQYGYIGKFLLSLLPYTFNVGKRVVGRNFGTVEIDFSSDSLKTRLSIMNEEGVAELSHEFNLHDRALQERKSYCPMEPSQRGLNHLQSVLLVLYMPFFLNFVAIIIFIRKKSRSF